MVDLLQLQQYLDVVKEAIPAINTTRLVIDDSQIVEIMRDIKESENLILLGIVPSHAVSGQDIDDMRSKDMLAFLVLKKVDRKVKHSEFIDNLHSCQKAIREVEFKLLNDYADIENCSSFLRQLIHSSITIDPVWGLAGTDGYEINFSLHTNL